MSNKNINDVFGSLTPNETQKARMFNKLSVKSSNGTEKRRRPLFRSAVVLATAAAMICLVIFGSMRKGSQDNNQFFVKAYAMEALGDGSIQLCEVDYDEYGYWRGYSDGENFYANIGLKCEGTNIKSVEFFTDSGFFAKQYIGDLNEPYGVEIDGSGAVFGRDFVIIGNKLTFDYDSTTDDWLLFWGAEDWKSGEPPFESFVVNAKATFHNGKTQEETVTVDLSNLISVSFTALINPVEYLQAQIAPREYYFNASLEECELLSESVRTVTNAWDYETIDNSLYSQTSRFVFTGEVEFDEDGIFRCGYGWSNIYDGVVIAVVKCDTSGIMTGMLYKVPVEMLYKAPDATH